MVEVEIRGKKFPLCLTVAALDEINTKFGGLKNLNDFLDGKYDPAAILVRSDAQPDVAKAFYNRTWMLGLLITEGEENRLVEARFDSGDKNRRSVPDAEALTHLLRPGEVNRYYGPIYQAINEGLKQEIEAQHPKNADHAERE